MRFTVDRWKSWAIVAMASLFCCASVAEAQDVPGMTSPEYKVAKVCTAGKLVNIGLKPQRKIIVKAPGGILLDGSRTPRSRVAITPASWEGFMHNLSPMAGDLASAGYFAQGWCLECDDDELKMRLDISPAREGEPLELFSIQRDGSYSCSVYRGKLHLEVNDEGYIQPINILPLESYLAGVVPSEVPEKFEEPALRAMACVARTYTLARNKDHVKDGFELCDGVHCQVYRGVLAEKEKVNAVIADTAGKVLTYGGKPIEATYHAACGGWGEAPQNIWQNRSNLPYLQARPDIVDYRQAQKIAKVISKGGDSFFTKCNGQGKEIQYMTPLEKTWRSIIDGPPSSYCQQAPLFRWERSFNSAELLSLLKISLPAVLGINSDSLGQRLDVRVTKRSAGGRVAELSIVTEKGSFKVGGDKIRWLTSGGKISSDGLKSNLFYVTRRGDSIIFRGAGYGHGAGLCQEGAQGRALAGQTYQQILQHYYPGTALKEI